MNWDIPDDNRPSGAPKPPATAPVAQTPQALLKKPEPLPTVWFIDIWNNNVVRQGTVLRTIYVRERLARHHGEMPFIKVELVSYSDDDGKPQLDVITPSRHVNPKPSHA